MLDHREELRQTIATRSTQTNEVNRCVYVAAALALAAGGAGGAGGARVAGTGAKGSASRRAEATAEAVALVELGASAGLLLGLDRYDVELSAGHGTSQLGRPGSPVRCRGTDRTTRTGGLPPVPPIAGRVGIDRHPVRLDDADAVRWLLACLWPDVPGRVERFTAARDLLLPQPPTLIAGDMVDALPAGVAAARAASPPSAAVIIYSSWALTYLHRSRRSDLEASFHELSQEVPRLLWLTAEPLDCAPGITVPGDQHHHGGTTILGLREWRDGVELASRFLGTCHPHGEWIELKEKARWEK